MHTRNMYPLYFSFFALCVYFVFSFFPSLLGIFFAFTDWNSFSDEVNFVGLDNFKNILKASTQYMLYIRNTFQFTIITTVLKTVIGFCLTLLFTRKSPFSNAFRMVVFSPQVLSFLIVGLVFKSLLHPSTGFINNSLEAVGLGFLGQRWLTDLRWAFVSVMAVDVWKGVGYVMVVLIAGLQAIPQSYHEAARIDGATYLQRIFKITIPMLAPTLMVVTVLNVTYGFRVFDIIYVLTNGGPGYATGVINTAVFKEFSIGDYGMGTALSTVLLLFITLISFFIINSMKSKTVEA